MPSITLNILLDSNIWRRIADANGAESLFSLCRRRNLRPLVAPSVVYEAFRTKDHSLREKLIRILTAPSCSKLMPEAFEESEEFLGEVRRLRPHWLIPAPKPQLREKIRRDWLPSKGSFWDRAKLSPHLEAERVIFLDGDSIDLARQQARERRFDSQRAGWKFETVDIESLVAGCTLPQPGWDGAPVSIWRVLALDWATYAFLLPPYSEWFGELIDFCNGSLVHQASWVKFWIYDADQAQMPRWWLRGVVEVLQSLRKVSDGTPCDAQLSTYLFSCDCFLTNDKAFTEILERCRKEAPRRMGKNFLVPVDKDPFQRVMEVIESVRRQ